MKTTIGGDRLGSGNKQELSFRNYERSTHDLGHIFRSSMSAGTLVPFMKHLALPGDNFDIKLNLHALTLPTLGPLFGSYKIQADVFQVPIRLYNAGLHMNKLGIGMDMSKVYLPKIKVFLNNDAATEHTYEDNSQVNPSGLLKYLGISGIGRIQGTSQYATRNFNAVPYLAYWDIYKNYYANKQEEKGVCIHTSQKIEGVIEKAELQSNQSIIGDCLDNPVTHTVAGDEILLIKLQEPLNAEIDLDRLYILIGQNQYNLKQAWQNITYTIGSDTISCIGWQDVETGIVDFEMPNQTIRTLEQEIQLREFPLENIDTMREKILQYPFNSGEFVILNNELEPYSLPMKPLSADGANQTFAIQYSQEALAIKTYQSDLFNNWISTEWIDGTNGINEVTSVSTAGDSFTIDALNLANKVYNMLNRIAISGGTYDDWLDAVYTHDRAKSVESPIYHGSLIKEMAFQEVVSTADSTQNGNLQPVGTLHGRGQLTDKHKGGHINIKVDEPSYIMGIVSITPRIDYSQGNDWDVNLNTLNDLHKPALDAIGYQDLITEQMCWSDTIWDTNNQIATYRSAGKQPAWINYMTAVNKCYGNFAIETKDMFMTLNRRYSKDDNGAITDLTTYIDPSKFNFIFAQTELDAQNFWMQISCDVTARRKMSAKVIPNL